MDSLTRFITGTLRLRVNQSKCVVTQQWERKSLGFSLTAGCNSKQRLAPQTVQRFRRRVWKLTRRTRGVSNERMVEDLARYWPGWLGYFGMGGTPSVLTRLEGWTRRLLRSAIWKQWKRGRRRYTELRRRGVDVELAAQAAGSAHGPWRLANSPALAIDLPNAYFAVLGLPSLQVRQ